MASETQIEAPATVPPKEEKIDDSLGQPTKTYLSRTGDEPLKPIDPENLPSYRQKTNRMFSFKPKTTVGSGANESSVNNFFSKFALNK